MISLKEYLIAEKLRINNNYKPSSEKMIVRIPKNNDGDLDIETCWKSWELPKHQWLIAKDCYRSLNMHFFWMPDWLLTVCMFENDYEDFNPKEDIHFSSNSLTEAFEWYVKELGFEDIFEMHSADDIISYIEKHDKYSQSYYDSAEFFAKIQTKDWTDDDCKTFDDFEWEDLNTEKYWRKWF